MSRSVSSRIACFDIGSLLACPRSCGGSLYQSPAFSAPGDVPEQARPAARGGKAKGRKADKKRAVNRPLLPQNKCHQERDCDATDNSIGNHVGDVHRGSGSDVFGHVANLFNEMVRRHTSRSRKMQVDTSKNEMNTRFRAP
jgi:hypothetical protein